MLPEMAARVGRTSDAAAMPEQQQQDDDDHDEPDDAVTAMTIIAAAITPIAATAAKQQDEDDDQKNEGHRTPRGSGMPARVNPRSAKRFQRLTARWHGWRAGFGGTSSPAAAPEGRGNAPRGRQSPKSAGRRSR